MLNLASHGRTLSAAIATISVALSAWFLAQGASYIAAGSLLCVAPFAARIARARAEQPPGTEPADGAAILARNIFDATVGPLWPPQPALGQRPDSPIIDPDSPGGLLAPPCEGSLRMRGATYFVRFPQRSLATLGESTGAALYREGALIADKEIIRILPRAAVLRRNDGALCSVTMFLDKSDVPARETARVADRAVDAADLDRSIRALSETEFGVQRTLIDRILQNPSRFVGAVQIVPHEESGRVVGAKVYGIRRNTLLSRLGVQNGDLLRTVNGIELSDPSGALEAYALLRSADRFSVAIVRSGRAMTLDYDVR